MHSIIVISVCQHTFQEMTDANPFSISDQCVQKVSQFMTKAARLNEAFSVVRRVPIVRPALPAPGVNSWPVMSMR